MSNNMEKKNLQPEWIDSYPNGFCSPEFGGGCLFEEHEEESDSAKSEL